MIEAEQRKNTQETPGKTKKTTNVADLPLTEKMRRAETYLTQFKRELDDFFRTFERANPSPQEMQPYMARYNNIIQGYTGKINTLKLVCPSSKASDPQYRRYISWTGDFQKKDQKVMQEASKRIQKILKKAGFSTR